MKSRVDLHDLSYNVHRAALHVMKGCPQARKQIRLLMHVSIPLRTWPSSLKSNFTSATGILSLLHASTTEACCSETLIYYLQVPLLQAGRLTRYASSICSCRISSGFTVSTQRQAAFSSCKRGAIILRCNVNHAVRYISQKR